MTVDLKFEIQISKQSIFQPRSLTSSPQDSVGILHPILSAKEKLEEEKKKLEEYEVPPWWNREGNGCTHKVSWSLTISARSYKTWNPIESQFTLYLALQDLRVLDNKYTFGLARLSLGAGQEQRWTFINGRAVVKKIGIVSRSRVVVSGSV